MPMIEPHSTRKKPTKDTLLQLVQVKGGGEVVYEAEDFIDLIHLLLHDQELEEAYVDVGLGVYCS